MDACPDFIGVVKIFTCLELEPRVNIKTDLTGQAKLNIFQRSLYLKRSMARCAKIKELDLAMLGTQTASIFTLRFAENA
jgi:hypothetical protein